jgi:hypothetical protein
MVKNRFRPGLKIHTYPKYQADFTIEMLDCQTNSPDGQIHPFVGEAVVGE